MNKIENADLSDKAVNQISDVIVPMIKERDKEIERLNNIINELEKYTEENIKVLENRLSTPFCNFEKLTKELSIFQNYKDKLKELKGSESNE